ncbi:zinc finger protein 865-like [Pectinophora gossypiella]|uniref:zinc finger protein 865-like n=1 Tax=Pectinophora gossypiella TaxID=13191 RepID=UPI00214E8BBC|nr:zinc finger protein 865-like [Pectinophora gossypiella]
MATMLKVEAEAEACCVCGGGGELLTPEEHDAATGGMQTPLRTMLQHLNNNKVVPEGRVCGPCAARAADAYELSCTLAARSAPPLADKIRALRRRLHELTQKIDVFIVVGGGAGAGYGEDDIIMVEKEALAAAAAADDDELEHARDARGDPVFQCSVCPLSFRRAAELRAHAATHPPDATHSCWVCGAQFAARDALRAHAAQHAAAGAGGADACALCGAAPASAAARRLHAAACAARCPACGAVAGSRAELAAHAAARHGRGAAPPLVCPACFRTFDAPDLLSAHVLRHRQAKQFVCGYAACVLRFASRANLMAHIRKCHAAEPPEPEPERPAEVACDHCDRTFASAAAMKRHAHTHQKAAALQYDDSQKAEMETEMEFIVTEAGEMEAVEGEEGEVEYLEVETLEDAELVLQQEDDKSAVVALQDY